MTNKPKPSNNLIAAALALLAALVFFGLYNAHPELFPTLSQLPPTG
jgi:hypothetical protein